MPVEAAGLICRATGCLGQLGAQPSSGVEHLDQAEQVVQVASVLGRAPSSSRVASSVALGCDETCRSEHLRPSTSPLRRYACCRPQRCPSTTGTRGRSPRRDSGGRRPRPLNPRLRSRRAERLGQRRRRSSSSCRRRQPRRSPSRSRGRRRRSIRNHRDRTRGVSRRAL